MSGTVQTTLEVTVGQLEPDKDEKRCIHDWCPEVVHKNGWAKHIRNCTPPAGWDDGGGG